MDGAASAHHEVGEVRLESHAAYNREADAGRSADADSYHRERSIAAQCVGLCPSRSARSDQCSHAGEGSSRRENQRSTETQERKSEMTTLSGSAPARVAAPAASTFARLAQLAAAPAA